MHYGEDTLGAGNYAPVSGTVVYAGWDSTGTGLGWCVGIRESANPSAIWWTGHFGMTVAKNPLLVSGGATVTEGQYLGPKGATGAAKGAHAHQERRINGAARPGSGTPTNPRPHYTTTAGGTPAPLPHPVIKGSSMSTLYYKINSNPAVYALAGDGFGSGGWLEIEDVTLASALGRIHNAGNGGSAVHLSDGTWNAWKAAYTDRGAGANGGFNESDRATLSELPTKSELGQALTSTVALVNEHADDNKDAIIAAMPTGSGGGSSSYNLSLTIDEIPGTATGTATAN